MASNYSNCVSNVVCIDILNSSIEDISEYCANTFSEPIVERALRALHRTIQSESEEKYIQYFVFIEMNYIIGSIERTKSGVCFELEAFVFLPEINYNKVDKTIFKYLEKKVSKEPNLNLNSSLLNYFSKKIEPLITTNQYDTRLISAHIEVRNSLAINMDMLSEKHGITIEFLNCEQEPIRTKLVLSKIYYKNLFPIIFIFKDEHNKEHLGWNSEYLLAVKTINPISFPSIN